MIDKDKPYEVEKKPLYKTLGITGTNLLGGFITNKDKNPMLTGRLKYEIFDEMLITDPIISRSFLLLKNTLLSSKFKFVASNENDAESKDYAKFMNMALGLDGEVSMLRDSSFESILDIITLFIPYGFRYLECIYYLAKDDKGVERVWLANLQDREPTAHYKWISENGSDLSAVQQLSMIGGVPSEPIPADKLLLFTLNKTGANFEGQGLLRPCYFWWNQKQSLANLASLGFSRWTAPTPVVKVDRSAIEASGYSDEDVDTMIQNAAIQASNYASLEQSFLVANAVISFESFGGGSNFNASQLKEYLNEVDNQLSGVFLSNFLNLGISSTGSRSVGEVHSEFFRLAMLNILEYICSIFNGKNRSGGGLVGRLLSYNFGEVSPSKFPRLVAYGLDTDELSKSMFSLPQLVSAGLLNPDEGLLAVIRDKLGIPVQSNQTNGQVGVSNEQV